MVRPAGGGLLLMEMEPITLRMRRPAVRMKKYDGKTLFDIGQNQAGICLLTLRGKKGEDHSAAELEMKSYCKQFKKEYGKPLIIMWQKG